MKRTLWILWSVSLGFLPALPTPALAALPEVSIKLGGEGEAVSDTIQLVLLFTLLSFAPAILIGLSSFVRILIVLGFLRQAIGTQQMPPSQVIISLALFLTFFVMTPTIKEIEREAMTPYVNEEISAMEAVRRGFGPLRAFMLRQTREKDLGLFLGIAKKNTVTVRDEIPAEVVIPAFMISELRTAFTMAFLIYVPFLVLDMVVASVLTSMGMMMLPPVMISLPFKLMIFVLVDGWNVLVSSLVESFR